VANNPTWQPNSPVATGNPILDPAGNVQEWLGAPGTTGALPPSSWGSTLGAFTQDGSAVINGAQAPGGWTCVIVLQGVALPTGVISLPVPSFVNDADGLNPNAIVNDMISEYQAATGRTLYPAQVERLFVNLAAYRESLVRLAIQYAALQNLVAYAAFPNLDYLGALLGVTRLPAQGALTTIQFTLAAAQPLSVTIPAGTLIGTQDGAYVLATQAALLIPAGATTGVVNAVCTVPGTAANGYSVGQVNVQLTPNTLISAVSNTSITTGGAPNETDAHLRARIQAAPNQFSVAGPVGAYRFFALGADPSIVDVQVVSPAPGQVTVYILTGPITAQPAASPNNVGVAGPALLAKVLAILNSNSIRPLTDTVSVMAVGEFDYTIAGTVTLYSDADPSSTTTAVNFAAAQFAIALASRIQRDIVPSQVVEAIQAVPGVYEVVLTSPALATGAGGDDDPPPNPAITLAPGQWANCTAIALSIVQGTEHS
jgi:phage-related baseplate assembly protein